MKPQARFGAGLVAALSVAALAAVGLADDWVAATPSPVAGMQVEAQPSEVTLACSPGIIDPFTSQPVPDAQRWSSVDADWGDAAAVHQADEGQGLSIPSALTVSAQGGGELRSLVASGCQMPLEDQWVAVGATTTGEDLVLILANPSTKPSVAHLGALGTTGPLNADGLGDLGLEQSGEDADAGELAEGDSAGGGQSGADDNGGGSAGSGSGSSGGGSASADQTGLQQLGEWSVDVPAGQVVAVLPATWWPDQDSLAIRIQAEGPALAVWAQSSSMIGEVPTGLSQTTATVAATDHVLAGTTSGVEGSVLRLAVPGSDDATVSVQVQGAGEDWHGLAGAEEVTVAAGTVLDVNLQGLDEAPGVVRVQSDQPVVAQAMMVHSGAAWPDSDDQWLARSALSPSWQVTRVALPSGEQLQEVIAEQANQEPERATSVTTDSGLAGPLVSDDDSGSDTGSQSGLAQSGQLAQSVAGPDSDTSVVSASLLVTNTSSRDATLTVGGSQSVVEAGTSSIVDVPREAATLTSSVPINAAVIIQAQLKTGQVQAVWPLGSVGVSSQALNVRVSR